MPIFDRKFFDHPDGMVAQLGFAQSFDPQVLFPVEQGVLFRNALDQFVENVGIQPNKVSIGFFEVFDIGCRVQWLGDGKCFDFSFDPDADAEDGEIPEMLERFLDGKVFGMQVFVQMAAPDVAPLFLEIEEFTDTVFIQFTGYGREPITSFNEVSLRGKP